MDHRTRLALSVFLVLTASALLQAQQGLRIVVVGGAEAINRLQPRTAVSPAVEVHDRNNQPVAGAIVTFTVTNTRRATFPGGLASVTATTAESGRASSMAVEPRGAGRIDIQVRVTHQRQTASAVIHQTIVENAAAAAPARSWHGFSARTIAEIGAAAGGGILIATRIADDSERAPAPSVTLTAPLSGSYALSYSFSNIPGTTPRTCTLSRTVTGTVAVALSETASGAVSGIGSTFGSFEPSAVVNRCFQPGLLEGELVPPVAVRLNDPLGGTTSNLTWTGRMNSTEVGIELVDPTQAFMDRRVTLTHTLRITFTGQRSGSVVNGVASIAETYTCFLNVTTPCGDGASGGLTVNMTLR